MKSLITVLTILVCLLLASCSPQQPAEEPTVPTEPIESIEATEPIEILKPVEQIEPLQISITPNEKISELELQETLVCSAKQGKKPYTYIWSSSDPKVSVEHCESRCPVIIDSFTTVYITCSVTDAQAETKSASATLTVTKEKLSIDSFILFGDSLTAGYDIEKPSENNWAAVYAKKNLKSATVFNYAINGATSFSVMDYQWQKYLNDSLEFELQHKEKLIVLWVGANDIIYLTPVEEFNANYNIIVNKLLSIDNIENSRLILLTIPDVSQLSITDTAEQEVNSLLDELGLGVSIELKQLGKDIILLYNQVIYDIAKKHDLPVIDMFTYIEAFDDKYIGEDYFHPNSAGHQQIAEKFKSELEGIYPTKEFQ